MRNYHSTGAPGATGVGLLVWLTAGCMGLFSAIGQAPPAPGIGSPTNTAGARIRFDSLDYDFGEVTAGAIVHHDYYFTNTGTELLQITNVQPQCGCTTAGNWTHEVKPGEWGVVPIQLNSANFDAPITKFVTVVSNDKSQPRASLRLKGKVWKPILVSPQSAMLSVRPDAPLSSALVRITNRSDQPLVLSPPESSNNLFTASLRTNSPGKDFLVTISNATVLRPRGQAHGQITLATTWTNLPEIRIPVTAVMGPSLTVSPSRIPLQQLPLTTNYTAHLLIINNTTNHLTLSDANVTDGVTVEIQESQPGKSFRALVNFPAGFNIQPGKPVLFTAKTSDPDMPIIKVPAVPIVSPPRRPFPRPQPHTNVITAPPTAPAPAQH